jgi:sialic acid synthase SpsE
MDAAQRCGGDAIKLQTYTADTTTFKHTEAHYTLIIYRVEQDDDES